MWRKILVFVAFVFIVAVVTDVAASVVINRRARSEELLPLPNCIAVVGDSLAAGTLVVQLPGVNFVTIQTRPLAKVIEDELAGTRYADVPVKNFAVPATYLAADGLRPYRTYDAYLELMRAACDVVVMTPWDNDLRLLRDTELYVKDVALLVTQLRLMNPDTRVLLWSHFWGAPQSFVEGYGNGITYNNTQAHREALMAACQPDGRIGKLGGVMCVDLEALFANESVYNVVIGNMSRSYFYGVLYGGLSDEERGAVEYFFNQSPNAQAVGDGVHFTEFAKRQLARTVIEFLNKAPSQTPKPLPPIPFPEP